MGFIFGIIRKLFKLAVYFLIFVAIIVLIPNLPPYTTFTRINLEPPLPLTGPLALNSALNNAERLYTNKVLGPEAFELHNGEVYTSLATGEIMKLSPGGHVTFVTKIGQPCSGIKQEHICGRPLGFSIDGKNNLMYVADAYHGIWKVDLKTDKKQLLVSPNVEIKGRTPKLFNDVKYDSNGNLYWTDSTCDFKLKDGAYSVFSDPSGRLFQYNAAKNTSTVLLDKLWFANGVAISPDNQFVVVAETMANKLHKYYINGPKKGKSEAFIAGLPGLPDNIQVLPDGSGLIVSLSAVLDQNTPGLSRSLPAAPLARKFLARIQRLIEIPFEFLNTHYPHHVFEDIVYKIGHFHSLAGLTPDLSGIIQLDWDGNVVAAYYNTDGSIGFISDAIVFNDRLYLGRPHGQNFVGSVPAPPLLKKAYAVKSAPQQNEAQKAPKVVEKPKVVEPVKVTTPKPEQKVTETKPQAAKLTPQPPKPTTPPPKQATQPPKQTPPPVNKTPSPPAPKPQEKKETPKPTQAPPKVTKPAETVKTTTQTPTEKKENVATSTTTQKPTTAMPKSKTEPPKTPSVKPEVKTAPPKATEEKVKPAAKPAVKPKSDKKVAPQQIPITEEIPSDTVKPNKETLKVIKRDGPTEIPNPEL